MASPGNRHCANCIGAVSSLCLDASQRGRVVHETTLSDTSADAK